MTDVVFVTTKDLISAFTDLDDDSTGVACKLRDVVKRHANRISDRLILVKNKTREKILHIFFRDDYFVMVSLELLRDSPSGFEFIQIVSVMKANCKRVDRSSHLF